MPFFLLISFGVALGPLAAAGDDVGSKACARCHAEIYKKYMLTGMARTSGSVGSVGFRESFSQAVVATASAGARAVVSRGEKGYRVEFTRAAPKLAATRTLEWFVGSGHVGRSYLFSVDGFLFQSPVSYYAQTKQWDVSPGFQQFPSINLTRAVEPACLNCHASQLQPVAGTQNGFRTPPFLEGGIGCERCHGGGKEHSADPRRKIVNPAKLDPARRDSVCAQCHLTGAARIARLRKDHDVYQPGKVLGDYSAFFVLDGGESRQLSVNSHFEKLVQSNCKRVSGDKLWCGSCHDPHSEPEAANRVALYRARCEKCHAASVCKRGEDCTGCHMPKNRVRDADHSVYTDHSIPRGAPLAKAGKASSRVLRPFYKTPTDNRDYGLALAAVSGSDAAFRELAMELLRKAESVNGADTAVLSQLAQLYDAAGQEERALTLYERILRIAPAHFTAAVNLGTYYAARGHTAEAIRLWKDALERSPGLTGARVNLAVAQFRSGDAQAAEATLEKALEYDPDHEIARKMLSEIQAAR